MFSSSCINLALIAHNIIYCNNSFCPWTLNFSGTGNKFYAFCNKPMLYTYFLFVKSNEHSSVLLNNFSVVVDIAQHSILTLSFLCFCNINGFCFSSSFFDLFFFVSFSDTFLLQYFTVFSLLSLFLNLVSQAAKYPLNPSLPFQSFSFLLLALSPYLEA